MRAWLETLFAKMSRVIGKPWGWERIVGLLSPPGELIQKNSYRIMLPDGYAFAVDPATLIGWNIHFFGTYEPEVRQQIKSILKPGGVAFDIGANVGWHTCLMASIVGSSGKVYAFEPNPTIRTRLLEVISFNHFSQVHVSDYAISDREGEIGFEAPPAGSLWDGTGHLSVSNQRHTVVPCTTIDFASQNGLLNRLDLIKIDIEGWEWPAIRKARQTLESLRPKIIFEYDPAYIPRCGGSWAEITDFLTSLHYKLFFLDPRRGILQIESVQPKCGNVLAVPA